MRRPAGRGLLAGEEGHPVALLPAVPEEAGRVRVRSRQAHREHGAVLGDHVGGVGGQHGPASAGASEGVGQRLGRGDGLAGRDHGGAGRDQHDGGVGP